MRETPDEKQRQESEHALVEASVRMHDMKVRSPVRWHIVLCTAHFHNSVNNRYDPDATKDIVWGDQSCDEMMIGFFKQKFA